MIPVARPRVGPEELAGLEDVLESGWLTQGPQVEAFEKEFAAFVGAPHAVAVSSCTAALHLALLLAGVGPGDEVAVPSLSFVATTNAVWQCGARPVFVDVEPGGVNLDPAKVKDVKAIVAVHQMGMPCDLEKLLQIGVPVIEDAACAVGSLYRGERIGRPHGLAACFSFHPRKLIATGEGGMLTTADAAWAERARRLRQHGMSVAAHDRHLSGQVESYLEPGFNYRYTDLQAAVGRAQLRRLPEVLQRRREQVDRYKCQLALPVEPEWARSNWQSLWLDLGQDAAPVRERLRAQGIATRPGIMCAHLEPAWSQGLCLPHSEAHRRNALILPLYHELTDDQIDFICAQLC